VPARPLGVAAWDLLGNQGRPEGLALMVAISRRPHKFLDRRIPGDRETPLSVSVLTIASALRPGHRPRSDDRSTWLGPAFGRERAPNNAAK
jgi:hypothetical protein